MLLLSGVFLVMAGGAAQAEPTPAEQRFALSKELHRIKPVKPQIDRAIDRMAAQIPDPAEQKAFAASIRRALNYKGIEETSMKAMADIFTLEELQAMVAYYSKPEAISAAEKMPEYQKVLGDEMTKMLDRAMMEFRTGRAAN